MRPKDLRVFVFKICFYAVYAGHDSRMVSFKNRAYFHIRHF